jgi:hypothetical protein
MSKLYPFSLLVTELQSKVKNAGDSKNPYNVYEEQDVQKFMVAVEKILRKREGRRFLSASEEQFRGEIVALKIQESKERALREFHQTVKEIFGCVANR